MQNVHAGNAAIPSIGFCTYGMTAADIHRMIPAALGAGFRHIDTVQIYRNEGESHAAHWQPPSTLTAPCTGPCTRRWSGPVSPPTEPPRGSPRGRHIPRQSKP